MVAGVGAWRRQRETAALLGLDSRAFQVGLHAALADWTASTDDGGLVALNRTVVNASITTVLIGSRGTDLLTWNEHAHLGEARTYR